MMAELGEVVNKTPCLGSSSLIGWSMVISVSSLHCSYPFVRVYLIMRRWFVSSRRIISFQLVGRSYAFVPFFFLTWHEVCII